MSEYEKNGGDYPDKGGTWSGPVSDDKDRGADADAPAAGGVNPGVATDHAAGGTGTQDGPLEDMHTTTVDEKIEGIIAQCRQDYAGSPDMDLPLLVRRRLEDSGIPASDDDIRRIVARVGDVNDGTRSEPGVHPER
ncbi:MAG TPA: hypothetical protein VFY91_18185 [Microbacterium sp.]|nr:hypothetical protein [Microbacterium sp.]